MWRSLSPPGRKPESSPERSPRGWKLARGDWPPLERPVPMLGFLLGGRAESFLLFLGGGGVRNLAHPASGNRGRLAVGLLVIIIALIELRLAGGADSIAVGQGHH